MRNQILFFVCLIASIYCQEEPNLKLAVQYSQLQSVMNVQIKPALIDPRIMALDIPGPFPFNLTDPVQLEGQLKDIKTKSYDASDAKIVVTSLKQGNGITLGISDFTLTLQTNATVKLMGKQYLTDDWMDITIGKLGLTLDIGFVPNTTVEGWVFSLALKNSTIQQGVVFLLLIDNIKISSKSKIFNFEANTALTALVATDLPKILAAINPIINSTLQSLIKGPLIYKNKNLTISAIIPTIPVTSPYNIDTMLLSAFVTSSYNNTSFPLKSHFPVSDFFDSLTGAQLGVSSNFFQLVQWTVQQEIDLNITIDNSMIGSKIIQLTTSGLRMLFKDIVDKYGPNKGIYLSISETSTIPHLFARDGRFIAVFKTTIDFTVDKDSTNYPQQGLKACTTCESFLNIDSNFYISIELSNKAKDLLTGMIVNTSLEEIKVNSATISTVDLDIYFNDLLQTLLQEINDALVKGVKNPLIGQYGLSDLEIRNYQNMFEIGVTFDE